MMHRNNPLSLIRDKCSGFPWPYSLPERPGAVQEAGKSLTGEYRQPQNDLLAAFRQENLRLEHNLAALRDGIDSLGELAEEMKTWRQQYEPERGEG